MKILELKHGIVVCMAMVASVLVVGPQQWAHAAEGKGGPKQAKKQQAADDEEDVDPLSPGQRKAVGLIADYYNGMVLNGKDQGKLDPTETSLKPIQEALIAVRSQIQGRLNDGKPLNSVMKQVVPYLRLGYLNGLRDAMGQEALTKEQWKAYGFDEKNDLKPKNDAAPKQVAQGESPRDSNAPASLNCAAPSKENLKNKLLFEVWRNFCKYAPEQTAPVSALEDARESALAKSSIGRISKIYKQPNAFSWWCYIDKDHKDSSVCMKAGLDIIGRVGCTVKGKGAGCVSAELPLKGKETREAWGCVVETTNCDRPKPVSYDVAGERVTMVACPNGHDTITKNEYVTGLHERVLCKKAATSSGGAVRAADPEPPTTID